jgi:hypothetical protein
MIVFLFVLLLIGIIAAIWLLFWPDMAEDRARSRITVTGYPVSAP